MKAALVSLLLCFGGLIPSRAQNPAEASPRSIVQFKEPHPAPGEKTVLLSCPYAEPQILDPSVLEELRRATLVRIDLLYTRFRRSEDFDQYGLNTRRWKNLEKLLPGLFDNKLVYFQNTEQTGAADLETAETYFHGFCIYYRIPSDTRTRTEEIRKVAEYVGAADSLKRKNGRERNLTAYDSDPLEHFDTPPRFGKNECDLTKYLNLEIRYPKEAMAKGIRGTSVVSFVVNRAGGIQDFKIIHGLGHGCEEAIKDALEHSPAWEPAVYKGRKVNVYQELRVRFGLPMDLGETLDCGRVNIRSMVFNKDEWKLTEKQKIVSRTLNNQQNLQHAALAFDVTGSMGPFLADMLTYIKTNSKKIDLYAFFNDGDRKADHDKEIGNTKGIYMYRGNVYDSIEATVFKALQAGYGGDLPENDLEALLAAQTACPDCSRLIWIADNYAVPRDLALSEKITRPVLMILCGADYRISPHLLTLAKRMKAQVSVPGGFIPRFPDLKNGDLFKVRGETFLWNGTSFEAVPNPPAGR